MSEFGSSCDFCGTMLFKIDCSGGELNLLFSHNYYSCKTCQQVDLCYDCYSKVTGKDGPHYLELVNNAVLYKSLSVMPCDNHDWKHCDAYEIPNSDNEDENGYIVSGFEHNPISDMNYDMDRDMVCDELFNEYFDVQTIIDFSESCI